MTNIPIFNVCFYDNLDLDSCLAAIIVKHFVNDCLFVSTNGYRYGDQQYDGLNVLILVNDYDGYQFEKQMLKCETVYTITNTQTPFQMYLPDVYTDELIDDALIAENTISLFDPASSGARHGIKRDAIKQVYTEIKSTNKTWVMHVVTPVILDKQSCMASVVKLFETILSIVLRVNSALTTQQSKEE
jgi:hypothetical protein